jgi:hypothetical protein
MVIYSSTLGLDLAEYTTQKLREKTFANKLFLCHQRPGPVCRHLTHGVAVRVCPPGLQRTTILAFRRHAWPVDGRSNARLRRAHSYNRDGRSVLPVGRGTCLIPEELAEGAHLGHGVWGRLCLPVVQTRARQGLGRGFGELFIHHR